MTGKRVSRGVVARSRREEKKADNTRGHPYHRGNPMTTSPSRAPCLRTRGGTEQTQSRLNMRRFLSSSSEALYSSGRAFPPYSVSIIEASSERALRSRLTLRCGKSS